MGMANLVSGLNLNISQEWGHGISSFLCCYKFTQIKGWSKISGVGMVENRCGQYGDGALKLTVFEEWTDWIN